MIQQELTAGKNAIAMEQARAVFAKGQGKRTGQPLRLRIRFSPGSPGKLCRPDRPGAGIPGEAVWRGEKGWPGSGYY